MSSIQKFDEHRFYRELLDFAIWLIIKQNYRSNEQQ